MLYNQVNALTFQFLINPVDKPETGFWPSFLHSIVVVRAWVRCQPPPAYLWQLNEIVEWTIRCHGTGSPASSPAEWLYTY